MSLITKIDKESTRHSKIESDIRAEIEALMSDLPDNPNATQLSPNCFTISSKDLGDRWGVLSHNFRAQYRAILGLMDNVDLEKGLERVLAALKQGSIRAPGGYLLHLNEDVIKNVSGLLNGV
jgi:hypothetical protein